MDQRTALGEAVFQLTPTRTRCDLLAVSAGDGARERIASGLVGPFLSHVRSVRDQIPRGGYSFALRPPNAPAPWFTAGTLRRFVRFVATPEILERVVTIENEIVHIEDETDRTLVSAASEASGENSKHALLLVLENRKKMLQKEQGMAYARASIAGYEKSHVDDLVMFADAFGASRLREACISFKELCMEKEKDKLWMDELAALEASGHSQLSSVQSSGIMLTSETENSTSLEQTNSSSNGTTFTSWNQGQHVPTNGDATQSKPQVPMGWMPEYMYGFHGPMGPNVPPFQGYAYPGMQFIPPYSIHTNSQQHSHDEDFNKSNGFVTDNHIERKTSEWRSESEDGGSFDNKQQQKRSNRKGSRKVIIRNINYISKGKRSDSDESDASSDDDNSVDEEFLRREVEGIVGSFGKHKSSKSNRRHSRSKSGKQNLDVSSGSNDVDKNDATDEKGDNNGWGAFQNILMKDESSVQDKDQEEIGPGNVNKHHHADIVDEYCTLKSNSLSPSSTYDYQHLDGELGKGTLPKIVESDPIVVNGQMTKTNANGGGLVQSFEYADNYCQNIKKAQNDSEEFLLPQKNTTAMPTPKDFSVDETPVIRSQKDGDWFVVAEYESKSHREDGSRLTFEADLFQKPEDHNNNEKRVEDIVFDDSVVVPERSSAGEKTFSMMEADMSVIAGLAVDDPSKTTSNQSTGYVGSDSHEPDDLQMLFGRDPVVKQFSSSSFPEVDFSADMSYTSANEKNSLPEQDRSTIDEKPGSKNKVHANNNAKLSRGDKKPKSLHGSLGKSRSELLTRNRKLSNMSKEAIQRTKAQMEEENRKRLEELMIERQKRIAQRSANGSTITATKQSKMHAKNATNISTPEKKIGPSRAQETKNMGMENLHKSEQNEQNGFGNTTKVPSPAGTIKKI